MIRPEAAVSDTSRLLVDRSRPWITGTTDSKTVDKGTLPY